MTRIAALARLLQFRDELVRLWHGFLDPRTPLYLKAMMIAVVAYLISPIDLIPDIIPLLGLVDDVALVIIAVTWIASKLPRDEAPRSPRSRPSGPSNAKTIDGTWRRH